MFTLPNAPRLQHRKGDQHEIKNLYDHHDRVYMDSLPPRRTYRRSRVGMCNNSLRMENLKLCIQRFHLYV